MKGQIQVDDGRIRISSHLKDRRAPPAHAKWKTCTTVLRTTGVHYMSELCSLITHWTFIDSGKLRAFENPAFGKD
jgi:hypothetical protein